MGIDPVQFFGIPLSGRFRQVAWIKPVNELLARKEFIVTVTPAQTRQIIDHGLRQIALAVILHDADRAVPFRKFFAVGT